MLARMLAKIPQILSGIVLALFFGLWCWISYQLLTFQPTTALPTLKLPEPVLSVAGFVSSAVGVGTASVLGIEIQKRADGTRTFGARASAAFTESHVLAAGVFVYAVTGLGVVVIWLVTSAHAPDVVSTFAWGALGWFTGAFSAVFSKSN